MNLLQKIKIIFLKNEEKKVVPSSEDIKPGWDQNPSELEVIPDGEYLYLDEEGESFIRQNYKNGKLHGPSCFHYVSGELWIEEVYRDGLIHGTTKYYKKDGSIIKTETWENGECISNDKI